MISGTQIRAGMTIIYKDTPHKVLTSKHLTPGNKRGFTQAKMRNLETGLSCENKFRSDEKIERAILTQKKMQYLYESGSDYVFMDTENYEQVTLSPKTLEGNLDYLLADVVFSIEFFKENPVGVTPPKIVEMIITETAPNLKGATATSSAKPATMETGLVINVPAFIESGELVRVDTEEGKYVERAK